MLRIKQLEEPPIFQTKELSAEQRRKGIKWFIWKFPIPRRGMHIPQELRQDFDKLMRKDHIINWTSYKARGRKGRSKPDLLLDTKRAEVEQPMDRTWNDCSDHTPIM